MGPVIYPWTPYTPATIRSRIRNLRTLPVGPVTISSSGTTTTRRRTREAASPSASRLGLYVRIPDLLVGYLLLALIAFTSAAFSYGIALLNNAGVLGQVINNVAQPLMLLSGTLLPIALAPLWLRRIADWNPFSWSVTAMRALFHGHVGRAVPTFISQAQAGEPLTVAGAGTPTKALCYVDETFAGIIAAARHGHPGPLNIGNPAELTVLDLAIHIRTRCGSASPITFVDRPVDDPGLRRPDISLARAVLDWQPLVDLEKGLAMTIDWFAGQLRS